MIDVLTEICNKIWRAGEYSVVYTAVELKITDTTVYLKGKYNKYERGKL